MTPRTLLALGAAVLAFSAGTVAVDATPGLGAGTAVAAETTHDVVVLGGGSGGYACALRAAELGLTVALVEKDLDAE